MTRRWMPCLIVVAVSVPIFFEAYRTFLFHTVPIDDYREYLLALLGRPGGHVPGSPFAYRIGSVIAAAPFYAMPVIRLSLAPDVSDATLRGAAAFSALNWISTTALSILFYRWAAPAGTAWRLCAAAVPLVASRFIVGTGVDAFGILVLAVIVYAEHAGSHWLARTALLLSVPVNEKVAIAATVYFGLLALRERSRRPTAACAIAAFAGYFLLRRLMPVPESGNAQQTQIVGLLLGLKEGASVLLSGRGLILNALPVATLLAACWLAPEGATARAALVTVLALAVLAMGAHATFNVGRVAMYGYPLVAAAFLERLSPKGPAS